MSREEYVAKRDALYQHLNQQMDDLKQEYIRSNSKFPNGTKVKIHYKLYGANCPTGYDECGIVIGYKIFFDDVIPIVAKMKKDGTAHATARIYIGTTANIEKCD